MSKTESIYQPVQATIEDMYTMTETENYFKFKLEGGKELGHKPGQFASISVLGIGEAPISVSSSPTQKGYFEMVIRKVGTVTGALFNLKKGDKVGVRGPFGTSFPVEELKGKDIVFIAGGIGLVPLRSAINYVLHHRKDYGKVNIVFGAKNPSLRLFIEELEKWSKDGGINFVETVDRGDNTWGGNVGLITSVFNKIQCAPANAVAIVCGPPVMYKFAIMELKKMGFNDGNIIVSLERRMKCGVGKCGHCQINGYYCCQEGPVFKLSQITNSPEAL